MNILVCIKQVPDMESKFKVDASGCPSQKSHPMKIYYQN